MKRKATLGAAVCVLLLACGGAIRGAAEDDVVLLKATGRYEARSWWQERQRTLRENQTLAKDDTLATSPGAQLDLRLGRIGTLRVKEGSEVRIEGIQRLKEGGRLAVVHLIGGRILVALPSPPDAGSAEVRTSAGTVALSGTLAVVRQRRDDVELLVPPGSAGTATLAPLRGADPKVTVPPGRKALLRKNRPIEEPQPLTDAEVKELEELKALLPKVEAGK